MTVVRWNEENLELISSHILGGKPSVLPTDTLYGLVARAGDEKAVDRVYEIKHRNPEKKCIVLIGDLSDLGLFDITVSENLKEKLAEYWPGKVSVELQCDTDRWKYLRRGTNSLSFRLPDNDLLRRLLRKTGPLIAPSANPEGKEPAKDIATARKYFGKEQEILFVDGGEKVSPPSTLISLMDKEAVIIRDGAVNIETK